MKLYQNWIINEVARAMTKGEHTYVHTYIRTVKTLYLLHSSIVRANNKYEVLCEIEGWRSVHVPVISLYTKEP